MSLRHFRTSTINVFLFLGITTTIILAGCGKNWNNTQYQSTGAHIVEKDIKIGAKLHANMEDGRMNLSLFVSNNSKAKIKVDYFSCSLMVESDRGAAPEINNHFKSILEPGESESYELVYHPVNSLKIYNALEYRGDMKQKYDINLDFIKDASNNVIIAHPITFELKDEIYKKYLTLFGKEDKIQLFNFGFNRDSFATAQKLYLETKEPSTDSLFVSLSNSEMIMGSRVFKLITYFRNDTLIADVTMTNKSTNNLKVMLDSMRVKVAGKSYNPVKLHSEFFNYNSVIGNSVIIHSGDRFNIQLNYHILSKFNSYNFGTEWLWIQEKNKNSVKLFCQDLLMK